MGDVKTVHQKCGLQPLTNPISGERPVPARPAVSTGNGAVPPTSLNPLVGLTNLRVKPAADPKKQFLEALMLDKDIESADRGLIIQLLNSDQLNRKALIAKLINRGADLQIIDIGSYDGKRGTDNSSIAKKYCFIFHAGTEALELLGIKDSETFLLTEIAKLALAKQIGAGGRTLANYLTDKELRILRKLAQAIEKTDVDLIKSLKEQIIWQLYDLKCKFSKGSFGSDEKIHYYKRKKLFHLYANLLGIKEEEISRAFFSYCFTALRNEDLDRKYLQKINLGHLQDAVGADATGLKNEILKVMKSIWDEYLGTPMEDLAKKADLLRLWMDYGFMASDAGATLGDVYMTRSSTEKYTSDKMLSLRELKEKADNGQVVAIPPRSLPEEIRTSLRYVPFRDKKYTNYLEALEKNCDVLYFTQIIKGSVGVQKSVGGYGGETWSVAGAMQLNGREFAFGPEYISIVIIHELEHILFAQENYSNSIIIDNSIPTERNSYLFESKAGYSLMRKLIIENRDLLVSRKPDKEYNELIFRIENLAISSHGARLAARAANIVMGYASDDENYNTNQPRPLPGGELPDLKTYATNLNNDKEMIAGVIKNLGITGDEAVNINNWHQKILEGKAFISAKIEYFPNGKFKSIEGITLIDDKGSVVRINLGDKAAILKPLQKIYGLKPTGVLDKETAMILINGYLV
ncbi:MAG: hypothetical protein AABZ57_07635, partial [Candidatus Margulisiibacteriota bacterium]